MNRRNKFDMQLTHQLSKLAKFLLNSPMLNLVLIYLFYQIGNGECEEFQYQT